MCRVVQNYNQSDCMFCSNHAPHQSSYHADQQDASQQQQQQRKKRRHRLEKGEGVSAVNSTLPAPSQSQNITATATATRPVNATTSPAAASVPVPAADISLARFLTREVWQHLRDSDYYAKDYRLFQVCIVV